MGDCKAGIYKDNIAVTHFPLMCFGGLGQPRCEYLDECVQENGLKKRKRRKRSEVKNEHIKTK